MSKRSFKAVTLVGAVCVVVCGGMFGREVGASGYLPVTGPVPLRFGPEPAPSKPFDLPPLLMDDSLPPPASTNTEPASASPGETGANSPEEDATETIPSMTTASAPEPVSEDAAAATLDMLYGNTPSPVVVPGARPPDRGPDTAASNVLVVTPQMLVEYFKPQAATVSNAVNTAVLVPVGFTPPVPVGVPSSQATYRTP